MKQVTIHEAKTHLSRLIRAVLDGEEVIIARGKQPLVKLVALPGSRAGRQIGMYPNLVVHISDDFNEPIEDFRDYME